jgi:hypothetical protein
MTWRLLLLVAARVHHFAHFISLACNKAPAMTWNRVGWYFILATLPASPNLIKTLDLHGYACDVVLRSANVKLSVLLQVMKPFSKQPPIEIINEQVGQELANK